MKPSAFLAGLGHSVRFPGARRPTSATHALAAQHLSMDCFLTEVWGAGDTHGIVGDDWATLRWDKLNYLATLGQYPWCAPLGFGV